MASDERTRFSLPAALVVGPLLIVFAVLSYSAAMTKCPTVDEPVHLTASYICRFMGDYRSNPEHPVLWKYWATIFLGRKDIHIDTTSALRLNQFGEMMPTPWPFMLKHVRAQFECANDALFGPRSAHTEAAVAAGRGAMLILGVVLGLFIALCAGRLGGAAAAVIAAALFAFDPNMLAHSSLVTNDIAFTLCFALVAWTAWLVGRRLTLVRGLGLALACALAINVKYSAVICGPIVALLLLARAFVPAPWPAFGKAVLRGRLSRLTGAILLGLACVTMCIPVTWAAYGFRFGPSNDRGELFNTPDLLRVIRWRDRRIPIREEPLKLEQVPMRVRAIWWIEEHRLLPQAYTYGLLRFEKDAVKRSSFLCGEIRSTGWWYYYPAAILFKTPLATLALGGLALAAALLAKRRRQGDKETGRQGAEERAPGAHSPCHLVTLSPCHSLWTIACLLLPPAVYLTVGMASAFNIGIRHIFPIYPFLFIGAALPLAWLWCQGTRKGWRWGRLLMLMLVLGMAAETVAGYPHYIAFFNQACGGYQRGGRYLADSNLDWGQDLKLLAEWQSRHSNDPLYLCYFGHSDPEYYHISYIAMPGGYEWTGDRIKVYDFDEPPPTEPGWLAISVTYATGALFSPEERAYYRKLADLETPDEILGGSIYLYRYPKGR